VKLNRKTKKKVNLGFDSQEIQRIGSMIEDRNFTAMIPC